METVFKITVQESVEKEISIKLPAYKKSICHFFKVYSQENCICITDTSFNSSIAVNHSGLAFHHNHEDCTEEEFLNAYSKVSTHLEELALGM